ncbi:hypothetical protein HPB47_022362 [Ixodes persulcatus]|uniref:Uncharacterized protein n=1 Tax=Ixodes persulcatus TaxID=34615 RepID=A0AC60Q9V9_IXOPE|nr:hypothetical protein HPB47_022362 [Ixodes persulcatus]
MWRRVGFGNLETTTRNVTLILGDGLALDSLPHQGSIDGTQVLFSVPGRPPMCLRCKRVGHMRRQCTAPWCSVCRGFGHEAAQCPRSYAAMTGGARAPEHVEEQLDNADMEEIARPSARPQSSGERNRDRSREPSSHGGMSGEPAPPATAEEVTASPTPDAIAPEATSGEPDISNPEAVESESTESAAKGAETKDTLPWQTLAPSPSPTLRRTPSPNRTDLLSASIMHQAITAGNLKVGTLNTVSLVAWKRKQWLLDLLNEEKIDIAFIQETKLSTPEMDKSFVRVFGHDFFCVHTLTTRFSGGTAVLVRKRKDVIVVARDLSDDGRAATADFLVGDRLIRFVSVYAPNNQRERRAFFETLRGTLDTPGDVVLGGDFNCVLAPSDKTSNANKDSSAATLRDVIRDNDLIDVTTRFPGFAPRYTRWQGGSHARLDRLYVSGNLIPRVGSYHVKMVPFSDHGLVTTEIKGGAPGGRRPRGPWKMNMAILDDEGFYTEVRRRLEHLGDAVDACAWEELKGEIRNRAERFSRAEAAAARQEERDLTNTLRAILEEEERRPGVFAEDVKYCKERLLELLRERLKGAQAACCPGSTANQIHRSWARFIWRSSMERTRRSNLFLSLAAGGMGLVNVTVKLHVQRFLLFRDRRDPLVLSALHHLGLPYLGKWMASTTGRTTKGAGLRFYAEIYLMTASRKKLYWDTLEVLLPVPLYRTVPAPKCASGLFKQVRKLPVPATSKDFFVRLHLGVLPVKVWLDDRGLFVPWSTNCDLCGANETLPHVFVECSNAYLFWDEMRKDLGVDFPIDWHVFR